MLFRTALTGFVTLFLAFSSAQASLTSDIDAEINAAISTGSESAIQAAVEKLSRNNPALADEIAAEAAKKSQKGFSCSIASAAISGSSADPVLAGKIINATASAVGMTTSELLQCVSAKLKLSTDAMVAILAALDATAAGGPGGQALGPASTGAPPPHAENPRQDDRSPS